MGWSVALRRAIVPYQKESAVARVILLALFAAMIGIAFNPANAADMSVKVSSRTTQPEIWRYDRHGDLLPFSRTRRSQAVFASDACWSDCQSFCTWNQAACLQVDAQGRCLRVTDSCDRSCQRECRTRGGPFLSFDVLVGD